MHKPIVGGIGVATLLILFATLVARADTVSLVTSLGGLSATDTIAWSQLGADATVLTASPSFTSTHGVSGSAVMSGPNSLIAVVCPASPCSWNLLSSSGFSGGDSLIWTADTGNSGNGPLTLNFTSENVSGAGAVIQADGPAQFTASIQAFDSSNASLGGPFTVVSDVGGDATFIGVLDSTAPNIHSVVFSISSCTGDCTDFAIDTVSLNAAPGGPTPTATPTATPTPFGTVSVKPTFVSFGNGTPMGKTSKAKMVTIKNTSSKSSKLKVTITDETTAAPFAVKSKCIKTLAPGKSCKVSVTFTPPDTNAQMGQLMISDDASNGSQTVQLTGTGK